MLKTRKKNLSIGFSSRTWRCRTMRKTRNLLGTVQRPSINAQTSGRFTFTRNQARKVFLECETFLHRNFILKPIVADAAPTRFRHSKHFHIPRPPTQIRGPWVLVAHLNPGKRSLLVRTQVTGRFWTKAKVRNRSTEKTSRSRSSRYASC